MTLDDLAFVVRRLMRFVATDDDIACLPARIVVLCPPSGATRGHAIGHGIFGTRQRHGRGAIALMVNREDDELHAAVAAPVVALRAMFAAVVPCVRGGGRRDGDGRGLRRGGSDSAPG